MSGKGVVFNLTQMCELAVSAAKYSTEVTDQLDVLYKNIAAIREDDSILSGDDGSRGAEIREALMEIEHTARDVASIVSQIKVIVNKQLNQMAEVTANRPDLKAAREEILANQAKVKELTDVKAKVRKSKK